LTLHGCLYALPIPGLPTAACGGSAWDGGDDEANWPTPNAQEERAEKYTIETSLKHAQ
jgi:hypothetical protein